MPGCVTNTLVRSTADGDACRERYRRLECEAGSHGGTAASSEERHERTGDRNEGERLERASLGSLPPGETGALRALAEVRAQLSALLPRQTSVELTRDRELSFAAGDRSFELFAQRAACTEDERLDCARRDLEDLGDLGVRAPLELAHHECRPLVEGEMTERAPDVVARRSGVVADRVGDVVLEGHLGRTPRGLAEPLPADVVGDGDQPVLGLLRPAPLLDVGAIGVQEGRLGDVLGVGGIPHDGERVPIHVSDVSLVEPLEGPVRARPRRQQGRHAVVDTRSAGNLASP